MRARKVLGAGLLSCLLVLGPSAGAAEQIVVEEKTFTTSETTSAFAGNVDSVALRIAVGGLGELTVGKGVSDAGYQHKSINQSAPVISADLLIDCNATDAITVNGSSKCLDSDELSSRGFSTDGQDVVDVEALVRAGIAQLQPIDSTSTLSGQAVKSEVAALVIPNIAQGKAVCDAANPTGSATGLTIPQPLAPVITGEIATASCTANAAGFPTVSHMSEEVNLGVTLTQSIVNNVPQLNDALDQVQQQLAPLPAQVTEPVNNVIDAIQAELSASPAVELSVAPNGGRLTGAAAGLAASSDAVAVKVVVLGGIIELRLATAETSASVLDQKATSDAGVAALHVRVLNITTPDPDDALIDQEITIVEDQDLTLLEGTPLESTIKIMTTETQPTGCKTVSAVTTCSANAAADSLSVLLFQDASGAAVGPLPPVSVELAGSVSQVEAQFQSADVQPFLPLARTGAGMAATAFVGTGLVALAAVVRRRFGL